MIHVDRGTKKKKCSLEITQDVQVPVRPVEIESTLINVEGLS